MGNRKSTRGEYAVSNTIAHRPHVHHFQSMPVLAHVAGRLHLVEQTTLDPVSTSPYGTAPYDPPNLPR